MFTRILVATDGSPHAEKAQRLGADLAQRYGAELIFLSAVDGAPLTSSLRQLAMKKGLDLSGLAAPDPGPMLVPEAGPVLLESEHTLAASRIRAELAERIVVDAKQDAVDQGVSKVKTVIVVGDAAASILATAEREMVDAIVMGSRGLGTLKGLVVGSVSHKVAHLAACTCISVK